MDQELDTKDDCDIDEPLIIPYEEYDDLKAKQRASILWLVSKAHNNRVPSDLRDPYYRDHDNQDRLKPQIIHTLANAELYCLALANIYADPNYHSLNHHGILQVLLRKGVYVIEPPDISLTETVLVQTAPIRMNAHMAVIEGIMALYIKEVLIPEKVMEVVRRFAAVSLSQEMPSGAEEAALLWVNKSCVRMRRRIEESIGACHTPDNPDDRMDPPPVAPTVPVAQDISDFSDGCCLAALLSFYCPNCLPWQDICWSDPMSLSDSLYNIQLVQRFCEEYLPQDICFLTLEDFLYMHPSIKENVLAFLADLMFIFEIRPAKCVRRPGMKDQDSRFDLEAPRWKNQNGQRESPVASLRSRTFQHSWSPIPDLHSEAHGGSTSSLPDRISPRSNGTWVTKDKPYQNHSVLRKGDIQEDGEGYPGEVLSLGSFTELGQGDARFKTDEDEEIAACFAAKRKSSPSHIEQVAVTQSHITYTPPQYPRRKLCLFPGAERYQPDHAMPVRLKEVKEKTNHETKDQERGEEQLHKMMQPQAVECLQSHVPILPSRDSKESIDRNLHNSPRRDSSSRVGLLPDHVEEDFRRNSPIIGEGVTRRFSSSSQSSEGGSILGKVSNSQGDLSKLPAYSQALEPSDRSRLLVKQTAGLEDYYNQLASEGSEGEDRGLVPNGVQGKKFMAKEASNILHDLSSGQDCLESGDFVDHIDLQSQYPTTSFAQLSKLRENPSNAISIVYTQHGRDKRNMEKQSLQRLKDRCDAGDQELKSNIPSHKTTTWQQQQQNVEDQLPLEGDVLPDGSGEGTDSPLAAQLYIVRLKLEERRRRIELKKRRMEALWQRQRQKFGKAAFLKAVSKSGTGAGTPGNENVKEETAPESSLEMAEISSRLPLKEKQLSFQEIAEDLDSVKRKWLNQAGPSVVFPHWAESKTEKDTDLDEEEEEPINVEEFQTSIDQINTSLADLQADIARVSHQQQAIQQMMQSSYQTQPEQQFFLHGQPPIQQQNELQFQQQQQPLLKQQEFSQPYQPPVQGQRRPQWGEPVQPQQTVVSISDQASVPVSAGLIQQWQQPHVVPMRPPSVEPTQLFQGRPVGVHAHHYEQRPPSTLPCGDGKSQGFSLHPPIQDGYPNFSGYSSLQPGGFQNGPVEGLHPDQYGYQTYISPPSSQYDSVHFPSHIQYGGVMYTPSVNVPGQPQQGIPMSQEQPYPPVQPAHSVQSIPHGFQRVPPGHGQPDSLKEEHWKNVASNPSVITKDVSPPHIEAGEFGRPSRPDQLPSPPNRPVFGRTFRVSKPKVLSSPTREQLSPTYSPLEPPDEPNENLAQPGQGTSENDKGFYISFGDTQPRKPKPKLRPRSSKGQNEYRGAPGNGRQSQPSSGSSTPSAVTSPTVPSRPPPGQETEPKYNQNAGTVITKRSPPGCVPDAGVGFVIGADLVNPDPDAENEMQRRKEMIMMISLRRRAEQESNRICKEQEYAHKRLEERHKREEQERKREDDKLRRQIILEQYRQRKMQEEMEKDGGSVIGSGGPLGGLKDSGHSGSRAGTLTRPKPRSASASRPRPKSVHVSNMSQESTPLSSLDAHSGSNRGSQYNLAGLDYQDDLESLCSSNGVQSKRAPSPGRCYPFSSRNLPSSQPVSLLPGLLGSGRGRGSGPPSDGASDTASTISATMEYTGPKLFVKPTTKSNRGIILNAINTVLAGAVNADTKKKVVQEINLSDSKHFLILFRDSGCQFRALYSYNPDKDEVLKLYGTGPKVVTDQMMDRFFKYNSGGKCFSGVQTKHLTVTIDAFTIHNNLWTGKRVIPPKKDFF